MTRRLKRRFSQKQKCKQIRALTERGLDRWRTDGGSPARRRGRWLDLETMGSTGHYHTSRFRRRNWLSSAQHSSGRNTR
jgi:hypothetical protein